MWTILDAPSDRDYLDQQDPGEPEPEEKPEYPEPECDLPELPDPRDEDAPEPLPPDARLVA
jgi:hypothetical protein